MTTASAISVQRILQVLASEGLPRVGNAMQSSHHFWPRLATCRSICDVSTMSRAASFFSSASSEVESPSKSEALCSPKIQIWLKLILMLLFPLTGLLVMTITTALDARGSAQIAQSIHLHATAIQLINRFCHETQYERGHSKIFMLTQGNKSLSELLDARADVDDEIEAFQEYIDRQLGGMTVDTIMQLALVSDFMNNFAEHRAAVDALSGHWSKETAFFTEGIKSSYNVVAKLAQMTEQRRSVFLMLMASDLFDLVEIVSEKQIFFGSIILTGSVSKADLQELEAFADLKKLYMKMFLEKTTDEEADLAEIMSSDKAVLDAERLDTEYMQKGPGPLDPKRFEVYWDIQNKYLSHLYETTTELMKVLTDEADRLSMEAIILQVVYYTALVLCVLVASAVGFSAAKSVGLPFIKLHSASEKLNQESRNMQLHGEVTRRFVPYETVELIGVKDITHLEVGQSVLKRLSIMFGDIIGFTSMSSKLTPDDVFSFINFWLEGLIPVIQKHSGTIDKFLGDGFVAFFVSAEKAVDAGVEIFDWALYVNDKRKLTGGLPLKFGLGCNSGDVCLGTVGSADRMDTLTISEAVTLANAVEASTRQYKANFLVVESIYDLLGITKGLFRCVGLLDTAESGADKVKVFECIAASNTPEEKDNKMATRETYEAAIELMAAGDSEAAKKKFEEVLQQTPEDHAAQYWADKIADELKNNVSVVNL